jgi:hypothetical protein
LQALKHRSSVRSFNLGWTLIARVDILTAKAEQLTLRAIAQRNIAFIAFIDIIAATNYS